MIFLDIYLIILSCYPRVVLLRGADLDQHKDGLIFTTVGSKIRINCCRTAWITSFIPDKGCLWPNDGERGTETAKDFDSIFERSQNYKPGLIHTIRRTWTETVEHEVGHLREIYHKPRRTRKNKGVCRMDLPGPTTSVGTRTNYSVGPWDYPACATRHLKAWSTRTAEEKYSVRKLYMSCTVWKTPRRTRLVLSPYSDL
jgi:hypothetical protein